MFGVAAVAAVAVAVADATAAAVAAAVALANELQGHTKQPFPPRKRNRPAIAHRTTLRDSSPPCRQFEGAADEGLVGAEMLLQKQEEEVHRLQAHLASRLSRANLYTADDPLAPAHTSVLDLHDPLYTSSAPLRKAKVNMISVLESPR